MMKTMLISVVLVACCCVGGSVAELALPRGVPLSRASLYPAGPTFTCLDGSDTISFTYINDDYCDCEDGSDEPGTAACATGLFYCPNRGHVGQQVPSSWVNDGICDCCDGSDEYASKSCANTCDVLGAAVRARQAQINEMRQRGFELRRKLIEEGKQKLTEKETRLTELEREKEVANGIKEQRELAKTAAEEQERILLDAYQEAERVKEEEREAAERQDAELYFTQLDSDQNGLVTSEELMQDIKLDKNGDGAVTQDEVDSITMNKAEMDQEEFVTSVWPLLKPTLQDMAGESTEETHSPPPPIEAEAAVEPLEEEEEEEPLTEEAYEPAEGEDTDAEDEDDHEDDDEDDPDVGVGSYQQVGGTEAPSDPQYDPETQAAVDAAKEARSEHSEAEQKLRDIEREMSEVTAFTELDLGPERAFAALHHHCVTLENREYEYKLCLFEKATQKPRAGGIETSLGRWGHWVNPEEKGHTEQMYENGQQCWNGPKRSAHVTLTCGEETRLTDVTEPAMCEYLFTVETPAVCQPPADEQEQLFHDEL